MKKIFLSVVLSLVFLSLIFSQTQGKIKGTIGQISNNFVFNIQGQGLKLEGTLSGSPLLFTTLLKFNSAQLNGSISGGSLNTDYNLKLGDSTTIKGKFPTSVMGKNDVALLIGDKTLSGTVKVGMTKSEYNLKFGDIAITGTIQNKMGKTVVDLSIGTKKITGAVKITMLSYDYEFTCETLT